MKRLLSLVVVVLTAMGASAQITWNAKFGLGFSTCAGMNDEGDSKNALVGKLGVGIEYPFTANWSLMPSLEVAIKGTKWSAESIDETMTLDYVQIPILAAYRVNLSDSWNMTIKAGPYFAYGFSGTYKSEGSESGSSWSESVDPFSDLDAKRFDAGLDIGVDFEYHRFVFGLEFERGFISFAPDEAGTDIFNQAFYATVGWKF